MDRDVDSEAETRVVKLSKGRLVKPKKSRRPWRAYTDEEDETLLAYILKIKGKLMGNQVWMQLERKGVLPERTWQSLRNRFIRILLPNIDLHFDPVIARKIKVRASIDCTSEEENEDLDGSSSEEERQVAPREQDRPTKKGGRVLPRLDHNDLLHRETPGRNLGRDRPATDSTEPTSAQMSPPHSSKGPVRFRLIAEDSSDSDTDLTFTSHAASRSPPAKTPQARAPRHYSALEQSPNVITSGNEAESEAGDISRDRQEPQRSHNVSEEEEELDVMVDPLYEEYFMKYDYPRDLPFPVIHPSVRR